MPQHSPHKQVGCSLAGKKLSETDLGDRKFNLNQQYILVAEAASCVPDWVYPAG